MMIVFKLVYQLIGELENQARWWTMVWNLVSLSSL